MGAESMRTQDHRKWTESGQALVLSDLFSTSCTPQNKIMNDLILRGSFSSVYASGVPFSHWGQAFESENQAKSLKLCVVLSPNPQVVHLFPGPRAAAVLGHK